MADKTVLVDFKITGNKELERLQANFDRTRKELQKLRQAERDGTKTVREINQERARLNVELKANRNALTDQQNAILKNNNALKKNSGFVAGVRKGVAQWATSMIGITAAIAAVTKILGDAVKIMVNFEKANSKLAAITKASTNEMKLFSDQAKKLGASTSFTASEVTELQTEFAKLGFPTQDIIKMTEATLAGAAALDSELSEQAALTGATLKQFGLDASEASRVNDVLAKSASSSALDFQKLNTALPIVGATANAVGVDLERTAALLGTLSDRGLDASTSGTSLRNVFLELSKQGLTYNQAMAKINSAQDKAGAALELFGKRGATAGLILAESGASAARLEKELDNANGTARLMAQTMLNNVAGDVTKAKSAWEGFILSLEDGDGVISETVRQITQLGTTYLQMFTAINNNDFDEIANVWAKSLGIVSGEVKELEIQVLELNEATGKMETVTKKLVLSEEDLFKAAQNNEEALEVLNRRLRNATITVEQYQKGIELLAGGYKKLTEEEKLNAEQDKILAQKRANLQKREQFLNEKLLKEAEAQKLAEKEAEKKAKADEKEAERALKAEKRKQERLAAARKKAQEDVERFIQEAREKAGKTEEELEIIAIEKKFNQKKEKLKGQSEEEKQLLIQLEQEKQAAINAKRIEQEDAYIAEQKEKDNELREKKIELQFLLAEDDLARQNEILEQERANLLSNEELTHTERKLINARINKEIADNNEQLLQARLAGNQALLQSTGDLAGALAGFYEQGSAANKAFTLIQIGLDTAKAISALTANAEANPANAFTFGAAGIAQFVAGIARITANIASAKRVISQQPAEFEDGGVLQGRSHAQGGIPFTINGQAGFEAEGGEAIINKRSTAMFAPLLSKINEAGGGVAFARGGRLTTKFAAGGAIPVTSGVTAQQQQISNSAMQMRQFSEDIIDGINDKEVINVATNTSETASEVVNISNEATF